MELSSDPPARTSENGGFHFFHFDLRRCGSRLGEELDRRAWRENDAACPRLRHKKGVVGQHELASADGRVGCFGTYAPGCICCVRLRDLGDVRHCGTRERGRHQLLSPRFGRPGRGGAANRPRHLLRQHLLLLPRQGELMCLGAIDNRRHTSLDRADLHDEEEAQPIQKPETRSMSQ